MVEIRLQFSQSAPGPTRVDSARDIVLVRSKIRNNSAITPKKGLNLYRLNSAKNTTSIRPVTTSITWPCASPSVPASRFHTAIHGVRLGLRLGIHALAFSVPSSQTCASGPGDSSRGTHPAKTLGVHRARPHQSQPSRQCNASTRFEHPTLERSHRFRRA